MSNPAKLSFIKLLSFNFFHSCNHYIKITICFFLPLLLAGSSATGQNISAAIENCAGKTSTVGNFSLAWSVGESSVITTMENSHLILTNGLLQQYSKINSDFNVVGNFLLNDVTIYPNPVKSILNINMLHPDNGNYQLELLDIIGQKVKEVKFDNSGMIITEKWNLSGLPAGSYILNIRLINQTGELMKKGAYKIFKLN